VGVVIPPVEWHHPGGVPAAGLVFTRVVADGGVEDGVVIEVGEVVGGGEVAPTPPLRCGHGGGATGMTLTTTCPSLMTSTRTRATASAGTSPAWMLV